MRARAFDALFLKPMLSPDPNGERYAANRRDHLETICPISAKRDNVQEDAAAVLISPQQISDRCRGTDALADDKGKVILVENAVAAYLGPLEVKTWKREEWAYMIYEKRKMSCRRTNGRDGEILNVRKWGSDGPRKSEDRFLAFARGK